MATVEQLASRTALSFHKTHASPNEQSILSPDTGAGAAVLVYPALADADSHMYYTGRWPIHAECAADPSSSLTRPPSPDHPHPTTLTRPPSPDHPHPTTLTPATHSHPTTPSQARLGQLPHASDHPPADFPLRSAPLRPRPQQLPRRDGLDAHTRRQRRARRLRPRTRQDAKRARVLGEGRPRKLRRRLPTQYPTWRLPRPCRVPHVLPQDVGQGRGVRPPAARSRSRFLLPLPSQPLLRLL
jgi:hypothetical protein